MSLLEGCSDCCSPISPCKLAPWLPLKWPPCLSTLFSLLLCISLSRLPDLLLRGYFFICIHTIESPVFIVFSPNNSTFPDPQGKSPLKSAKDCWVGGRTGNSLPRVHSLSCRGLVLGLRPTHAGMLVFLLARTLQGQIDFSAK